ncbi:hypothetical protein [Pantoea ananatis]|uniref:hypothetical protein n=1 Tax=Pantoea ananas TaxID=553 RepID=UPI001B31724B|nr:hypothetical protein [Pantoea ananatis]
MTIKIEAPHEGAVTAAVKTMGMQDAVQCTLRRTPEVIHIGGLKGEYPAFCLWAGKAKAGEKLPRGKYFRTREFIRAFRIL